MLNVKCQMLTVSAATVLLTLAGCQGPQRPATPESRCPGKITLYEAAAALEQQRQQLVPLQASARCVMQWSDMDNKTRRESFDAQVRFVPPDKMFFRGDKFGEVRFGTNDTEFWLRIKAELDTYWYGTRDRAQNCSHVLLMNPANLAEALGMIEIDTQWELFHRDGRDWLTLREQGRPVKRVYVNACDYRVERIEYYDRTGEVTAATELSNYTTTSDGLRLPMTIRLVTLYNGLEESSAQFDLRGVRRFEPTKTQMEKLFERPGRDGYGTVLRLDVNCNFVEDHF